ACAVVADADLAVHSAQPELIHRGLGGALQARGRRRLPAARLRRFLLERALEGVEVGDEVRVERPVTEGSVSEVRGQGLKEERETERHAVPGGELPADRKPAQRLT